MGLQTTNLQTGTQGVPQEELVRGEPLPEYYDFYLKHNERSEYSPEIGKMLNGSEPRRYATNRWAWAVPSPEALEIIAKHSPIVEVCAGSGYWASLLSQMGVDILAYDNKSWRFNIMHFNVQKETANKAISDNQNRTLLMIWPPMPLHVCMAHEAAKCYTGNTVIYIGEGRYGCNASNEFFDYMDEHFDSTGFDVPQWEDIWDKGIVYKRNK